MNDDDLYVRHHALAALVSVLLHDLRNPLHSGTLLVDAMGSRTADVDSLRAKLRAQLAKLEALISEASDPIKELALEAHPETVSVDSLARSIVEAVQSSESDARLTSPPASNVSVVIDVRLVVRAAVEVVLAVGQRQADGGTSPPAVQIRVAPSDRDDMVRIELGDFPPLREGAAAKAPFAISGGGMGLAMARALTQTAGASLRMEQGPNGLAHFVFYTPKAG